MHAARHRLATTLLAAVLLLSTTRAAALEFVPEQVFDGRSSGRGVLDLAFAAPRRFEVASTGAARTDGGFDLQQVIRFEGQPARTRTWSMRRTGPGSYSAALTDAAGPVDARVDGPRMLLRYRLTRWGLVMHQTLDLADDGRSIANTGRIRFLGIPVGRLDETIRLDR